MQVEAELAAEAECSGQGPLALFAAATQLLGAPCLRGALAGPRLVADVADLIGPAMRHPSRAPPMADFRVPHLGCISRSFGDPNESININTMSHTTCQESAGDHSVDW